MNEGFYNGIHYHATNHGIAEGAGALWSVYDESTGTGLDGTKIFHELDVDAWISGHTHAMRTIKVNGKPRGRLVDGTFYLNAGHLTTGWGWAVNQGGVNSQHSTLLEFQQDQTTVRAHGFNHGHPWRNIGVQTDWEYSFELSYPFSMN